MKVSKDALRSARALLRSCVSEGRLDLAKAKQTVKLVGEKQPRGYLAILHAFLGLLHMEVDKRHATVESSEALSSEVTREISSNLRAKYGSDLTLDFKVEPALMGGVRVRVGSDVWDGSVRARLEMLRDRLA